MPHPNRRLLVVLVLLAGLALPAAALAQEEDLGVEPTASASSEGSFSKAFFISYKTDLAGRKSIEIIGSLIIWFLLLLSMVSIGLIGHMALTNQRKSIMPPGVVGEVKRLIGEGKYREALELTGRDESFFSQVLQAGLREASHGFAAVIRRLDQTAEELTTNRLRRIEYLNVLGQVSPMIGLFGTVYGMILAFSAIVASGGNADPILLAGGIGTALTTTFWGLLVAIPALSGYAVIRNRIDELTMEATLTAQELVNQFRPRASSKGSLAQANPSARVEA